MRRLPTCLVLLVATMILVIPVLATNTILFDPASVAIDQGGTANITILLDEAPTGLAEFQFDVLLSHPSVAHITGVTFPLWVSLGKTSGLPSGSPMMSGVDLDHQIEPGAIGIVLGIITVQGGISGTSAISIENIHADDDGGGLINPSIRDGTISTGYGGIPVTWTPVVTPPSVQSTTMTTVSTLLSDGIDNATAGGTETGVGTPDGFLSENSTSTLTVTEVPTETFTNPAHLTAEPTVPAAISEMETISAGTTVIPAGTSGSAVIPWYWLVVVIILVIISVYILYLAVTKKI